MGKALGKTEEAKALVAATEADLAARKDRHPEFAGKTFLFTYIVADSGVVHVYSPLESRVKLMQDLGFTLAPAAVALTEDTDFSLERLNELDTDVLIAWHDSEADQAYVETNPLLARYRPVAEKHYVPIVDPSMVMAIVAPSPLSLPWSVDWLTDDLAARLAP